jgi:hypothetical protein
LEISECDNLPQFGNLENLQPSLFVIFNVLDSVDTKFHSIRLHSIRSKTAESIKILPVKLIDYVNYTQACIQAKSNSSGGLQIEASKIYLQAHLQKIEAQN